MKTKINILIVLFSLIIKAQTNVFSSQNLSFPTDAVLEENTIQSKFESLDKSKIETGLLLDVAVEFADLEKYNGTVSDPAAV